MPRVGIGVIGPTAAVFGGSFDPPHAAHLQICRTVLGTGLASCVIVVPCVRHAFGKILEPFARRLEMCRLLCFEAGPGAEACDIEQRSDLSGLTMDTIEALRAERPGIGLRLVVGADALAERHRWHRFEDIERLAPPIVFARHGFDIQQHGMLPAPGDVSSTVIRAMIASGSRPDGLVPAPVLDYIERFGLYR